MSYTAIKTTWNAFAKEETKRFFPLKSVIKNVNKAVLEAYKLSNLHVLKCLQQQKDYTINQDFYYNCLAAVSELKLRKNTIPKDVELCDTLRLYNAQKPTGYEPAVKDYMGGLFNNAAQQMFTMAKNYFVYTFHKRLYKYLKHKYILWTGLDIKLFIQDVYNINYKGTNPEVWKIKELLGYEPPYGQNVVPAFYKFLKFGEATKCKLFTLLPNRKTFTIGYVKIDSTCLHDILISSKIMKRDTSFISKKRDYWTTFFNVEKFETSTKTFAHEILTDGKAVSIILKSASSNVSMEPTLLPHYDTIWGLDPGRTHVFTATNNHGDVCNVSTSEYYFDSKITEKNKKYSRWYKNDERVTTTFKTLPSLKTTKIEQFLNYLNIFFKEVDYLLEFHFKKGFRDVKFKTYVFAKKKLHKMCQKLVQGQTLIGFGDWSNQDSPVLRKPKGPVKEFKNCLKRYATIIDIDEFKTSQTCCCCQSKLNKTKVYTVLRCSNTSCERNLVNRDRNAANNILCLTNCKVNQEVRPLCFMRKADAIQRNGIGTGV